MSRFGHFLSSLRIFPQRLNLNLKIDLGSSLTSIFLDDSLIWQQPTLLAWHKNLKTIVAVGEKAALLMGKTPPQVTLIHPIQKGVIGDLKFAQFYLETILAELQTQQKISSWVTAQAVTVLPASASPLEKKQLIQVMDEVGIKVKKILSYTEAIVYLPIFKKITQSHGIIDFGAQSTDLGIFTGHQLYQAYTFDQIMGDVFTHLIREEVLSSYELEIGQQMAEKMKQQLINKENGRPQSMLMTVQGKDTQSRLVKTVRVEATLFHKKFNQLASDFLREMKAVLDTLPPDIMTQIQEQGFYITGEASQAVDWSALIKEQWQVPVIHSATPMVDVVKGLNYAA